MGKSRCTKMTLSLFRLSRGPHRALTATASGVFSNRTQHFTNSQRYFRLQSPLTGSSIRWQKGTCHPSRGDCGNPRRCCTARIIKMHDIHSCCYQISRAWEYDVYNREHTGSNLCIHLGYLYYIRVGLTYFIQGNGPYARVSRWQASRGNETQEAHKELFTASPAENEVMILGLQMISACMCKNIKAPLRMQENETEHILLILQLYYIFSVGGENWQLLLKTRG